MKLLVNALVKVILGILACLLLIFWPAGTLNYFNGWLFMAIPFIPMLILGTVLFLKNPSLLEKRLSSKEKLQEQSLVVKLSGLMFVVGFVVAGLDYRYGFSKIPMVISYISAGLFLFSYALYGEVMRENTFLSRTIEIQENQRVVDTGLYGIVRHPMYSATIILFLSMPLVLGSLYSFIIFLAFPFILVKRIKSEEELLEKELIGYKEYKQKVKYRLIPFVW